MRVKSKAYRDGYRDGLAWDLDGFRDRDHLLRSPEGWDAATINAMGSAHCAKRWGVRTVGGLRWEQACADYNAGAFAGACVAQEARTGLATGSDG